MEPPAGGKENFDVSIGSSFLVLAGARVSDSSPSSRWSWWGATCVGSCAALSKECGCWSTQCRLAPLPPERPQLRRDQRRNRSRSLPRQPSRRFASAAISSFCAATAALASPIGPDYTAAFLTAATGSALRNGSAPAGWSGSAAWRWRSAAFFWCATRSSTAIIGPGVRIILGWAAGDCAWSSQGSGRGAKKTCRA